MALVVEQRPEAELFVEENPTVYDTPYFTSRWNAANLPLVYKISNTKFPVNSEDTIESITTVTNNGGFAQLDLSTTTFVFVNKGYVEVTNTTNYNGVYQIREIVDADTIVINTAFIATDSGNVQNYYRNYNTLVKIYAGLPEYHPSNSTNPMTLITDNPIAVTPNSDNEAVIDVSALIKSKVNLDNDYDVNDLNIFTSFYIEYAERYDESNGTSVSTTTSTFEEDLIEGCDSGGTEFVTNGTFDTNLNDWSNIATGQDWSHDVDKASVDLFTAQRRSRLLSQTGLNLTSGTEYAFSCDYILDTESVAITITSGSILYQETLTGSGTISFTFIASGTSLSIDYNLISSPAGLKSYSIDNISITNQLTNPCLAYIFTTHSAQQPQYKYGGNMGEYVQNFNGDVFLNKWLTLFQKPVLFKDNYFDLATIIPQQVIQSAVQSGGFFLEIIQFDRNKEVIEENRIPITQNLGDGVYRFRLDDKDFNDLTKEFTAQILRIPVNLFVDGDQGTFDTTSNTTGNPPSDWNLEKDARSIINFDNTLSFEGAASLKFESRSIFNDEYLAHYFQPQGQFENDSKYLINPLNFNQDFTVEFYFKDIGSTGNIDDNVTILLFGSGSTFINIRRNKSGTLFYRISGTTTLTGQSTVNGQINKLVFTHEVGGDTKIHFNSYTKITAGDVFSFDTSDSYFVFNESSSTAYKTGDLFISDLKVYLGVAATQLQVDDMSRKNVIPSLSANLAARLQFNQEQSRQIINSEGNNIEVSDSFSNTELSFGGGFWVNESTI